MDYLSAFLVGGAICAIGQLVFDMTSLSMAHVMVLFVVIGSFLTGLGIYENLVELSGTGATIPVSNFGHVLTKGMIEALQTDGWFGLLTGAFEYAGAAIAAAILLGFAAALLFKPRG